MKCPVCKSLDIELYIIINKFKIIKCQVCGVLFTKLSYYKPNNVKNVYDNQYIKAYKKRKLVLSNRFKNHLDRIEKYKKGGRILDIGCGIGYFLNVIKYSSRYKWNICGVEKNIKLINYAILKNKKIINQGTLSQLPHNNSTFDCVTCFDVLEHHYELRKNINEIRRVIKKGGILVIQSPNYLSLMAKLTGNKWAWWVPPDHKLHFSFNFIVNYLKQNKFEILEKFTYEPSLDFLLNIKGVIGDYYVMKVLFYLFVPVFLIIERTGWLFNFGALSFIIVKKK